MSKTGLPIVLSKYNSFSLFIPTLITPNYGYLWGLKPQSAPDDHAIVLIVHKQSFSQVSRCLITNPVFTLYVR
jgi:hypothetical protein